MAWADDDPQAPERVSGEVLSGASEDRANHRPPRK